jgi:hypothetical protein
MNARVHLTWISPLLLDRQPFKSPFFAPLLWSGGLFFFASVPLVLSGQLDLVFTRPLVIGWLGTFWALSVAQVILSFYRRMSRSLKLAIEPLHFGRVTKTKVLALRHINNNKALSLFTGSVILLTYAWVSLSMYKILDRDSFPFFYFLPDQWYLDDHDKVYRLLSLYIIIGATLAILCAGLWFQYFHWRMFHQLMKLPLVNSPILIYQGFAKLWLTTNLSSASLLAFNILILILVDFHPHPLQMIMSFMITAPGVVGILWPTFGLYKILYQKKDDRTRELIQAAHHALRRLGAPQRTLGYSSVYSAISMERSVGTIQAAISSAIALTSLIIAILQLIGLDAYAKVFGHG